MTNDWLAKEHSTMTRYSEKDGEWLATYVEPELRDLVGLGKTPKAALAELSKAYGAWVQGLTVTASA